MCAQKALIAVEKSNFCQFINYSNHESVFWVIKAISQGMMIFCIMNYLNL